MVLTKCGIDIVRGCQLRCVGCPISTLHPKIEFMSVETWRKILHNLNVTEIKLLRLFNFGEPMLHPDLVTMVRQIPRHLTAKTGDIEISTNAQVCKPDVLRKIIHDGIITRIAVSCDGDGTPESFEQLRPPGKWSKLIQFMDTVGALKRELHSHIELVTRTICEDVSNQAAWRKIVKPYGFSPLFRHRFQLIDGAIFQQPNRIPNGLCLFLNGSKGKRLYVDIDGTVVPCCRHPHAFVMGNVAVTPFRQLRKTETYAKAVERLRKKRLLIPVCSECEKS